MKKIEIIPIAERKSGKRGIKRKWIEDTITNPTQTVEGYGGRKVAHKKFLIGGKEYLLRVVYEETEKMYTVVTAYLTSQIGRYWKE
ncbi:MAG TPA: DUF4258 domain-containing protein [Candidatus Brocadiia bacterium]|nr:DUF4258 domain-containing protein [Planctomycetota bacterium]MBI4007446.1 DUF4258 domain-containing protein [Planctomycetota bacterium]MDO8094112.1 DUF4258 domain-containing protein [Candidatus Brocadiales bacterium]